MPTTNNRLTYSLESRAKTDDALMHEWKNDLLRVWIPLIAGGDPLDRARRWHGYSRPSRLGSNNNGHAGANDSSSCSAFRRARDRRAY